MFPHNTAPASSHIRANSAANSSSSRMPARHFTVTTFPLRLQPRMTAAALFRSCISALPSPLLNTLGTGQPILISMMSNASRNVLSAMRSITAGLPPSSCTALNGSSSVVSRRRLVALSSYFNALALHISVKHNPAPSSYASIRNG